MESLEIYDSMIENDIFIIDNERLWDQDFISYVISATRLGKYEAIENFIKKFINRIQEDKKENMLNFANAHLYFVKGEFGKSLEVIAKTNYDLFSMKYNIKNLQIKNFYELNDLLEVHSTEFFCGGHYFS